MPNVTTLAVARGEGATIAVMAVWLLKMQLTNLHTVSRRSAHGQHEVSRWSAHGQRSVCLLEIVLKLVENLRRSVFVPRRAVPRKWVGSTQNKQHDGCQLRTCATLQHRRRTRACRSNCVRF